MMGIPIAVEPLVTRVGGFDIGEVCRIDIQLQRILQNMVLISGNGRTQHMHLSHKSAGRQCPGNRVIYPMVGL